MGMRNITLILKKRLEPQDELRKLERDEWMNEEWFEMKSHSIQLLLP